MLSDDNFITLA